jgi:hypothetical protein
MVKEKINDDAEERLMYEERPEKQQFNYYDGLTTINRFGRITHNTNGE